MARIFHLCSKGYLPMRYTFLVIFLVSLGTVSCRQTEPLIPTPSATSNSVVTVIPSTEAFPSATAFLHIAAISISCEDVNRILKTNVYATMAITAQITSVPAEWIQKIQYSYSNTANGKTKMIARMPNDLRIRLDAILACIGNPELYEVAAYPAPDNLFYKAEIWYVSRGIVIQLDCPPNLQCPPLHDNLKNNKYTLTPDTGIWRLELQNPDEAAIEVKKPYHKLKPWPGRIEDVRIMYDPER